MADYLGKISLGGFYKTGRLFKAAKPLKRPTRPAQEAPPDLADCVTNIPSLIGRLSSYSFGDTPSEEENQLLWHKIQDGSKTLLICDRNILVSVSWDELKEQGYVFGKTVTIDGASYSCRLLTGGDPLAKPGEEPTTVSEWDRFIACKESISGIPAPQLLDLAASFSPKDAASSVDVDSIPSFPKGLSRSLVIEDKSGPNNSFWNWAGCSSWCQESIDTKGYSVCVYRGNVSSSSRNCAVPSSRNASLGFRPVLEL